MFRFRLRTLLLVFVVLAIIGTITKHFLDWQNQLASEYAAAGVIRDVTWYVEVHHGELPKSWDDIPSGQYARGYVDVRFDLTEEQVLADPSVIYDIITPKSKAYYTYPHAEQQLQELRETVMKFHR